MEKPEYDHDDPSVFELTLAGGIKHRISTEGNMIDIVDPLSGEVLNSEPITERKKQIMRLLNTTKSIYPLCYCKVCQGDTKHADCPNQDNPHAPRESIWFKALRGEPIYITEGGIK